ncbi:MAG TPA: hypothetical protein VFL94_10855 [Actinomycetales bacterium]|nr:hypothetical protein [Actinomycetales bacterium]
MVTLEYARACVDEMHRQAQARRHHTTHATSLGRLLRRLAR